jgi:hypothetical protein
VATGYKAIWRGGKCVAEYENGTWTVHDPSYYERKRSDAVAAPMVIRDIGEYMSPLDGQHITSRSQHRDHMRAHEVVEVGNEFGKPKDDPVRVNKDLGLTIKRRLEEVEAMPQTQYDAFVKEQHQEHEAIGALVSAA